jgi:hypothetical protein
MDEREIRIDGENLRITVPIQMRRVAGRKMVILADVDGYGDSEDIPRPRAARGEMRRKGQKKSRPTDQDRALHDEAVRTALAIRWVRLLEAGRFSSMAELSRAVEVDPSTMARMVRRADGKAIYSQPQS